MKFDHMTPDPTGDPLRSSSQYPLPTPKARLKTYGERTFPVAAPGLCNLIPLGIRSISSIDSFKRRLKTYLFKQGYNPVYIFLDDKDV